MNIKPLIQCLQERVNNLVDRKNKVDQEEFEDEIFMLSELLENILQTYIQIIEQKNEEKLNLAFKLTNGNIKNIQLLTRVLSIEEVHEINKIIREFNDIKKKLNKLLMNKRLNPAF